MTTRFRFNLRKIAALAVLAVYGTGGVLGYGLHKLWHCEHCHTGACETGDCETISNSQHGDCNCSHHANALPNNQQKSEGSLSESHEDCPICAFLAQAQTPQYEVTLPTFVENVCTIIPVSESIGPLFLPEDHLARGPPLCS